MIDRDIAIEALEKVIAKSFGLSDFADSQKPHRELIRRRTKRREISNRLYNQWVIAGSAQWIERSETTPESDCERLAKAATQLGRAISEIERIGWHGSESLLGFATELYARKNELRKVTCVHVENTVSVQIPDTTPEFDEYLNLRGMNASCSGPGGMSQSAMQAKETVLAHLSSIKAALSDARESVDDRVAEAASKKKSKPKENAAEHLANECAEIYHEQTGKTPTVPNRPTSQPGKRSEAYGPFLELVVGVFLALSVDAKPLTAAKKANMNFSRKKT